MTPRSSNGFTLCRRKVEATAALLKETKVDLTAAIDSLRIEVEVIKTYMKRYHPEFAKTYPRLREEAIQAIDPEWIGAEADLEIYEDVQRSIAECSNTGS